MNKLKYSHLGMLGAVFAIFMCTFVYYYRMDQSDYHEPGLCKMDVIDGIPDPSTETCEFLCPGAPSVIVNRSQLEAASVDGVVDTFIICGLPPRTATFEPTPVPTDTPTLPPPPPLLTGEITACSLKDGFINFKLSSSPESYEGEVVLALNGVPLHCMVAGTDQDLFSCALPPGATFPAGVNVTVDGTSSDNFSYDGDDCAVIPENKPPSEDGPPVVPTLD